MSCFIPFYWKYSQASPSREGGFYGFLDWVVGGRAGLWGSHSSEENCLHNKGRGGEGKSNMVEAELEMNLSAERV